MLTSATLVELKTKSSSAISRMEASITQLNATIARAESETSRTREYILENIKAARDKVLPALSAELKIITGLAKDAAGQQKYWSVTPLLLSLQTFDGDAARDAQIRLARAAELSDMPAAMLNISFENARGDANLALIYQCWRAGIGRAGEAGFTDAVDLSLEGLKIPGQAEALAAIAVCESNLGFAEMIAAAATGMRTDPVRMLTVGRQQAVASRFVSAAEGGPKTNAGHLYGRG